MPEHPDEINVVVTEVVSDALGIDIEDLPPLSEAIDVDALEAVVPSTPDNSSSGVTVTFSYAGLRVFVCSGNTVYVRPLCDAVDRSADSTSAGGR